MYCLFAFPGCSPLPDRMSDDGEMTARCSELAMRGIEHEDISSTASCGTPPTTESGRHHWAVQFAGYGPNLLIFHRVRR